MPIDITVSEPAQGTKLTYLRTGPSAAGKPQVRLSFRYSIINKSKTEDVTITSITLGGKSIAGFFANPSTSKVVAKNSTRTFQNCNSGYENASKKWISWEDVVVLDKDTLTSVDLVVTVKGSGAPETKTLTIPLAEHTNDKGPLAFPGQAEFLGANESYTTSSNHGSGHQVFALDVVANGWTGTRWSELHRAQADLPESKQCREDYLIYGTPMFAMADGVVGFAVNDQPEWKTFDRKKEPQVDEKTGKITVTSPSLGMGFGGGNHLWVVADNEVHQYAHMQKGSIPAELMKVGAKVKRGQYLGKVGWSGTTSRPHFHIAVKAKAAGVPNGKVDGSSGGCENGPFRPMSFNDTWTLPLDQATSPAKAPATAWTKLKNQSAPFALSLIGGGPSAPTFSAKFTDGTSHVGIWHASNDIDLTVMRRGFAAFVKAYEQLVHDKFTLVALESYVENDVPTFVGVFRRGQAKQFLSQIAPWEQFVADTAARVKSGMSLRDVTSFVEGKTRWFVGVFVEGAGGGVPVKVDQVALLQGAMTTQRKSGRELIAMHSYAGKSGASGPAIGVFATSKDKSTLVVEGSWDAFCKASFDLCTGYVKRLNDIVSWSTPLGRSYAGIVRPDASKTGQLLGGQGPWSDFRRWSEVHAKDGWRLAQVHAH